MTSIYRAPGFTFGSYVAPRHGRRRDGYAGAPRTPAPRPATPARPHAHARPQRQAHAAWGVALRAIQRRLPRLTWILAPLPEDATPAQRRHKEGLLTQHGRQSYVTEHEAARRHERICRRAIREGWARVPEGVDRALAALETAPTREATWKALDALKAELFK